MQRGLFFLQIDSQGIPDQLLLIGVRPKIVRGVKAYPNEEVFHLGCMIIIFGVNPVASPAPPGLQSKLKLKC